MADTCNQLGFNVTPQFLFQWLLRGSGYEGADTIPLHALVNPALWQRMQAEGGNTPFTWLSENPTASDSLFRVDPALDMQRVLGGDMRYPNGCKAQMVSVVASYAPGGTNQIQAAVDWAEAQNEVTKLQNISGYVSAMVGLSGDPSALGNAIIALLRDGGVCWDATDANDPLWCGMLLSRMVGVWSSVILTAAVVWESKDVGLVPDIPATSLYNSWLSFTAAITLLADEVADPLQVYRRLKEGDKLQLMSGPAAPPPQECASTTGYVITVVVLTVLLLTTLGWYNRELLARLIRR